MPRTYNGPRANKTDRHQGFKTVLGAHLDKTGVGEYEIKGGTFHYVFRYDEHDRAWVVARADGEPCFWGSKTWVDGGALYDHKSKRYGFWQRDVEPWTLCRSLKSAVTLLRSLGYIPQASA